MPEIAQCTATLAELIRTGVSQVLEDYDVDEVVEIATDEEARSRFAEQLQGWIKELPRNSEIRQHLRAISRHPSVQLSALREAVRHLMVQPPAATVTGSRGDEHVLLSA